jgi:hypothetical protein
MARSGGAVVAVPLWDALYLWPRYNLYTAYVPYLTRSTAHFAEDGQVKITDCTYCGILAQSKNCGARETAVASQRL